jgi:hypothetical protein
LNVINGKVLKVLNVGVGLEVIDQSKYNLDWFLGPSSECFSELCSLSGSSNASVMLGVRNAASVSKDVLEVLFSLGDSKSLNGFSSLVGILVVDSKISSWALGNYIEYWVPLEVAGVRE